MGRVCEDFYDVECVIPQLLETDSTVTDAPVITPMPTKIPTNERK